MLASTGRDGASTPDEESRHAVQDGIATGIEGLDYLRIGLRPQFYRDGIKLVG